MENLQKHPLKLYIQDIFRAKRTESKYNYEIFGLNFKNIMIHGVVTAIYNKMSGSTNIELSDPTGSVQVYYDFNKNNNKVSLTTVKTLSRHFVEASRRGYENLDIMSTMLDGISRKASNPINFEEGSYLSVVGDIFIDEVRNVRMISAYECKVTSIQCDIVWLEELRYLYEKFYLWDKEN